MTAAAGAARLGACSAASVGAAPKRGGRGARRGASHVGRRGRPNAVSRRSRQGRSSGRPSGCRGGAPTAGGRRRLSSSRARVRMRQGGAGGRALWNEGVGKRGRPSDPVRAGAAAECHDCTALPALWKGSPDARRQEAPQGRWREREHWRSVRSRSGRGRL